MRLSSVLLIMVTTAVTCLAGCGGPPVYSIPSEPPPENGPLLGVPLAELRAAVESEARLASYLETGAEELTLRWTIDDPETASAWTDCGNINNASIPSDRGERRFDGPWTAFFLTGEGGRLTIELSLTPEGPEQTRVHSRFTLTNALVDGWQFKGSERRPHEVPSPFPGTRPTRYCQGKGELARPLTAHRSPVRIAEALAGLIHRTAIEEKNGLRLKPGDEHRIALFLSRGCAEADVQLLLHPNGQYEWQYQDPGSGSLTSTGEWELAPSDHEGGQLRLALMKDAAPWLRYNAPDRDRADGIDELERLTTHDTASRCDLVRVRAAPGVDR